MLLFKRSESSVTNSAVVWLFKSGLITEGLEKPAGLVCFASSRCALGVGTAVPAVLVPKGRFLSANSRYLQSELP